ncbi:HEAT repeat domain-containing protein [Odoribacter splanchnicus]|uniref:HEAT repeat domain-containing protein n=1 Tax=Odoribacter splanchnicus TaxID=28118 RepID=UPI001E3535D5|nr:HEAT repeat domain-containing protein [Odoribacter splanchnicus]
MNLMKCMFAGIALLAVSFAWGQTIVAPQQRPEKTSFAIVTDQVTWEKCRPEIENYRAVLEQEQLPAYILAGQWKNPEQIKELLMRLYRESRLEGAVFIGDIPIPMIRKAQHMTSAFKMDEEKSPRLDSSVPSDRFYDDFDLKFDYLGQDTTSALFFYYNLAADSPQALCCDIYTGRIKPLEDGTDRYQQIRDYLNKAVAAHQENNILDQFVSYTGEGSYSNSLTAWRMEQMILREQLPGVFDRENNARFMRYSMWDYPKEEVIAALQREDLDMLIFHEHGMSYRQYISATPRTHDPEEYTEFLKREFRSKLRTVADRQGDVAGQMKKWCGEYHLDTSWFSGAFDPEWIRKDSIADAQLGIVLEDVPSIAPNARFVIFDACYNGDFREKDYIAGRYIFSKGKCVVAFANSVNVLQDKSANDLFGWLGFGTRIGLWARYTNILESHIIGDPTFCFSSGREGMDCNTWLTTSESPAFWLEMLRDSPYADLQNMALLKLFQQEYPGISDTLRMRFETSPYAVVRYTCMSLLEELNDQNFREVLKLAVTDPYEFIRRIAIHRMGRIGAPEFLPFIIDTYLNDYLSERVNFNVLTALEAYRWQEVDAVLEKELAQSTLRNKDDFRTKLQSRLSNERMWKVTDDMPDPEKPEKDKIFYIRYLKNLNYHPGVPVYLELVKDTSASPALRKSLIESLAWFNLSEYKKDIITTCEGLLQDQTNTPDFRQEVLRTYHRLKGDLKNGK